MFRDLWALRLAAFGDLDRNGGLPFSTFTKFPEEATRMKAERCMNDSLIQVSLPFMQNKELFGDYVNIFGGIRFGKIMEDLDVFAATCAYMHCGTSTTNGEKLTIVTAAVDRIDVHMRLDEPLNLRMKGMVSFVGKSSMEVTIIVESSSNSDNTISNTSNSDDYNSTTTTTTNTTASSSVIPPAPRVDTINEIIEEVSKGEATGEWKLAALAKFIMVARNSEGPVEVPRLKLKSAREEAIFAAGADRNAARLTRNRQSLFKEPPTADESILLHKLFLSNTTEKQTNHSLLEQIPMASTILTTTKLCHPQERNIHDRIFGGFLMREAFELGFTCGQLFSHSQLHFLAVDELAFKHPVAIGSVLQLTAQVVYTQNETYSNSDKEDYNINNSTKRDKRENNDYNNNNDNNNNHITITNNNNNNNTNFSSQLIHVEVVADVLDIQSGTRKTTNTFHFTYRKESPPLQEVKPTTYAEAMKYLEGKRRISSKPLDPLGEIYKF